MDVATFSTVGTGLGAALLASAGTAKLAVPDGAMALLHRLRLPSGRGAARLLGMGEILTGVAIVIVGGVPAAALTALAYGVFLPVAAWQRRAQVACGCFGTTDTAVTRLHLVLNALFLTAGLVGLAATPRSLSAVGTEVGALGVVTMGLLLVTGAGLLRVLLERAAAAEVLSP